MKKILKLIISVVLTLTLSLAAFSGCEQKTIRYTSAFFGTFDTVVDVIAYESSDKTFEIFDAYTKQRFSELSSLYDIYENYEGINNIKTINDNAGIAPVKVSSEIIELLELAISWNEKSNGKFNIAMGSVLSIWHTARENAVDGVGVVPTIDTLKEANEHTNIANIVIDKENSTVYLKDKHTRLDVGAIGKGYAVEKVASELSNKGFKCFAISAGGNVRTVGSPKGKDGWGISIQDPLKDVSINPNENIIGTAIVSDMSVVSSGGYQRFFVADGAIYHHLIDPITLMPANYYHAVTVLAKDSGTADILSTVLFLMDVDSAIKFANELDGVEAIFVAYDGSYHYTSGMKSYLK